MNFPQPFVARRLAGLLAISLSMAPIAAFSAQDAGTTMNFMTHAAAYAEQNHGSVAIDPHVFVGDSNAPDITGPEGIHHIAGIRPARVQDDPAQPLTNAQGDDLDLSLGRWLGTTGTARTVSDSDGMRLKLRFTHAIPFGVYSVFLCRNSNGGYALKPLHSEDGVGLFTAPGDGLLHMTLPIQHEIAPNESILLVYHSDDQDHGEQPGDLGTDAHVQMVLFVHHDADDAQQDPQQQEQPQQQPDSGNAPPPAADGTAL